eukprot:TRINITY_DN4074_c0_g1_i1.p1 TRINITY_DN4074_c0_g1~~TRINITY_DN4074_c0_g1_i1.p1  ORF type:complete len:236 (+),score=26.47 TRINITY_DN4074_c0_g1_i1:327-1034(+)
MERTCVATTAERELQRRSYILTRLIEQNRNNNNTNNSLNPIKQKQQQQRRLPPQLKQPCPTAFETKSSVLNDKDNDEDDLYHLRSLREEVRRISEENSEKQSESTETSVVPCRSNSKREKRDDRVVSKAAAEVNLAAVAASLKVRVKAADMSCDMQERAFKCARQCLDSMDKLNSKRVALALKKEFDASYGPAWHCIVGTSFGSFVTHSLGGFLYFSIDKVSVLLFKTAVEPLDQ